MGRGGKIGVRMMSKWIETLLTIEAVVLVTVVALAAPIVLGWMLYSTWTTYWRNRR